MKYAGKALFFAFALMLSAAAWPSEGWSSAARTAGMSELEVGQGGWGGYLKSYSIGNVPKHVEGAPAPDPEWKLLNALRLNGFWRPAEKLKIEAGYELQPVWQSASAAGSGGSAAVLGSSLPLVRGASYRLIDLRPEITDPAADRDFRLFQNLDRLVAHWTLHQTDITIGRQAIAFGSAKVIQATDVLLPYSFQQLNVEYRIGVDAVRAQIPISQMGELDFGVVVGEKFRADKSAAFARIKASLAETDIVGMAMVFSDAKLLGGGLQRGIWQLGYNLDFAQVWVDGDERYFRLSQGLDYTFASGLTLFAEYHFNGAGASDPADYLARLKSFAYQKGGVFLLGRHYFIPGLSYQITPLLSSRIQSMVNLQDGSTFISGAFEYGVSENVYLDLGFFGSLGASPRQAGDGVLLASEFGSYPIQVYGAVRWYF